jgi:hypothetical protein
MLALPAALMVELARQVAVRLQELSRQALQEYVAQREQLERRQVLRRPVLLVSPRQLEQL